MNAMIQTPIEHIKFELWEILPNGRWKRIGTDTYDYAQAVRYTDAFSARQTGPHRGGFAPLHPRGA